MAEKTCLLLSLNPHPSEHALLETGAVTSERGHWASPGSAVLQRAFGQTPLWPAVLLPPRRSPWRLGGPGTHPSECGPVGAAADTLTSDFWPPAPPTIHSVVLRCPVAALATAAQEAAHPPGQAGMQHVGLLEAWAECGAAGSLRAAPTSCSLQFRGHRASPSLSPPTGSCPPHGPVRGVSPSEGSGHSAGNSGFQVPKYGLGWGWGVKRSLGAL